MPTHQPRALRPPGAGRLLPLTRSPTSRTQLPLYPGITRRPRREQPPELSYRTTRAGCFRCAGRSVSGFVRFNNGGRDTAACVDRVAVLLGPRPDRLGFIPVAPPTGAAASRAGGLSAAGNLAGRLGVALAGVTQLV